MRAKTPRLRILAFLLAALSGTAQGEVQSLFIQSRLDYNAILITEVDVVFVYDDSVLEIFRQRKLYGIPIEGAFWNLLGTISIWSAFLSRRDSILKWTACHNDGARR